MIRRNFSFFYFFTEYPTRLSWQSSYSRAGRLYTPRFFCFVFFPNDLFWPMHTTRKTRETQLGQRFSSFFTVAVNTINNKGIIVTTRNSNNSWDKQPAAGEKRSRRNYIITTSVRMCAGLADACGCCAKFGGFGSLPFLFFFLFISRPIFSTFNSNFKCRSKYRECCEWCSKNETRKQKGNERNDCRKNKKWITIRE